MRRLALTCVFALSAASGDALASPLELFGFGGRSPGLAGAGVADSVGFASVYLNPAGLAETKRKSLTLGTAAAGFRLRVNGEREPVDRSTAFIFGGAVPIPLGGALEDRVVFGLGFHVPNKALVRVDRPLVGEPTFVLLDNRADSVAAQVAAGVKVSDRLSVGAGVLILAALTGKITVTNDAAGAFVTNSDQSLETDAAPIVGARYTLSSTWRFGLTARGPSQSNYRIEIETDLTSIPLDLPELAIAGNAQYDPGMVALGAVHRIGAFSILGDLEYRRWSAFPRPTDNPVISGEPPPAPGFNDTVVPRLAVEFGRRLGPIFAEARAGYSFLLSPTPEMSGPATLLDNHRHLAALGLGVAFRVGSVPLRVDAWGQLHQLHKRRHDKEMAGANSVFAAGRLFAGGLTVGVEL